MSSGWEPKKLDPAKISILHNGLRVNFEAKIKTFDVQDFESKSKTIDIQKIKSKKKKLDKLTVSI